MEAQVKKPKNIAILLNGIITENPVMVLLLGTCPSLAVTSAVSSALGMGLATTFVLVGSNLVVSLIKNYIPPTVRIPCYIVVIAGFVTIIKQLMMAYLQPLYLALGVFLDLIVVNCILLGRAEVFASKNTAEASVYDGLGMGLGFTLALFAISTVRELFGSGSFLGFAVTANIIPPMDVFAAPSGGFFVYGVLIALVGVLQHRFGKTARASFACNACPLEQECGQTKKSPQTKAPHKKKRGR